MNAVSLRAHHGNLRRAGVRHRRRFAALVLAGFRHPHVRRVLLLDEIAGGLTDAECASLIDTIKRIHAAGTTIVWIEHVVHALLAVVERLIVIDFGRIIATGDPRTIMESREVQEIYLGIEVDA